jgi:hypothetical protein
MHRGMDQGLVLMRGKGTAYARNLPMLIIFMFLAGTAGSTALSNVAGTIADLFGDVDGAGQYVKFLCFLL